VLKIKLGFCNILTALDTSTIGSKVVNIEKFFECLEERIGETDPNSFRQVGQMYIEMPQECNDYVSAGVGKRSLNTDDYIVRKHRDKVGLYLKREFAASVDNVACVVYTKDAYLKDPDVDQEEYSKFENSDITHVLVAVLASAGVKSPLTPNRFIHNLAGGNNEALKWTADEIRKKAKEIKNYSSDWCVVAD